jgi:hypothetical protein
VAGVVSRRDSILKAAATSIARVGVRGLRVDEVAREAGVSLGLVYYHFTDRAGLLAETFKFLNDRAAGMSPMPSPRPGIPSSGWRSGCCPNSRTIRS